MKDDHGILRMGAVDLHPLPILTAYLGHCDASSSVGGSREQPGSRCRIRRIVFVDLNRNHITRGSDIPDDDGNIVREVAKIVNDKIRTLREATCKSGVIVRYRTRIDSRCEGA
jgi:hypothetical protein